MVTILRRSALVALGWLLAAPPAWAETAQPQSVGLSAERLERVHELVQRQIDAGVISGAVTRGLRARGTRGRR